MSKLALFGCFALMSVGLVHASNASEAETRRFTFASWNIAHFSQGVTPKSAIVAKDVPAMLAQYRDFLAKVNADVVGLAEYTHYLDAAETLGVPTVLFGDWRAAIEAPLRGHGHWNALFVRKFQTLSAGTDYYRDFYQPTHFVHARVLVGGQEVVLAMTHFEPNYPCDQKAKRASQIRQILDRFKDDPHVVIAGDFNVMSRDELKPFVDAGYVLGNDGTVKTWPAVKPCDPIDFVVSKGLKLSKFRSYCDPKLSDHCLVAADLEL